MTDLKGSADKRMILSIDFDGVVHDYKKGWQGGELYGQATPGFFEWYLHTSESFRIVIHSSRFSNKDTGNVDWNARLAVEAWLDREYEQWRVGPQDPGPMRSYQLSDWLERMHTEIIERGGAPPKIEWELSVGKPPAILTIDDRCVRFDGDWSSPDLSRSAFFRYRPWMTRA